MRGVHEKKELPFKRITIMTRTGMYLRRVWQQLQLERAHAVRHRVLISR